MTLRGKTVDGSNTQTRRRKSTQRTKTHNEPNEHKRKGKKKWKRWQLVTLSVVLVIFLFVSGVGLYFWARFENVINSFGSTPNTAKVNNVTKEPFAVMLLGAGTNGEDGEGAADSITLFVVNPAANVARIVSVPRDSYLPRGASCESPGYYDKIANSGNDISCLQDTLSEVFDVQINYHMSINFVSFVKIVDTLGGVEMDVPDLREGFTNWNGESMSAHAYKKNGLQWCEHDSARNPYAICFDAFGKNLVDGEHALALARSRHYDSDFSRSARQSELIRAIANKVVNNFNIFAINDLLTAAEGNIQTNIPTNQFFDFAKLGQQLMSSQSGFSIQALQLDGASSQFQGDLYYASFNQVSLFSIEHIRYQIAKTINPADFPLVNITGFYHDPGERELSEFTSKYENYNNRGFLKDTMDIQDPYDVKKYNAKSPYAFPNQITTSDDE